MKIPETTEQGKRQEPFRLIVAAECFLHGASAELSAAIQRQLTIANPKYQDARRYSRWVGKQLKPKLYFYRETAQQLIFPRGFANEAVMLSRHYMGRSPELVDQRHQLDAIELAFQGTLRPYQQKAVDDVLDRSFGVLEAGTGSGKTVMALNIVAMRRQPTIVIVHSKELLNQWRERIEHFLGIAAGQIGGGRFDLQPVTVAIVNTVRKHLDTLPEKFGHLIVDECHRVPASLFTDVVSGFASMYMLGLSATAFRREDGMTRLINIYLGDRLHGVDPRELTASGAVVQPQFIQNETEFSYRFRGEYAKLIKALANNEQRNDLIVRDIRRLLDDGHVGTVLAVSDRVAHCENLHHKLQNLGIDSALLTGRMSAEQRAQVVREVQEGKVGVLISTLQLIGEGFDCPGLATLVLATPIKFEGRLLQIVGRIMRPDEGKKARVIDYVDSRIPVLARSAASRRDIFADW